MERNKAAALLLTGNQRSNCRSVRHDHRRTGKRLRQAVARVDTGGKRDARLPARRSDAAQQSPRRPPQPGGGARLSTKWAAETKKEKIKINNKIQI